MKNTYRDVGSIIDVFAKELKLPIFSMKEINDINETLEEMLVNNSVRGFHFPCLKYDQGELKIDIGYIAGVTDRKSFYEELYREMVKLAWLESKCAKNRRYLFIDVAATAENGTVYVRPGRKTRTEMEKLFKSICVGVFSFDPANSENISVDNHDNIEYTKNLSDTNLDFLQSDSDEFVESYSCIYKIGKLLILADSLSAQGVKVCMVYDENSGMVDLIDDNEVRRPLMVRLKNLFSRNRTTVDKIN